jgi:membrane protein DedA with SNARE-associated domain
MSSIELFLSASPLLAYTIIFIGVMIEGEGIILLASVFALQGHLSWFWLAVTAIGGTIFGDVLWFEAGRNLKGTRIGSWLDKRYEKTGGWVNEMISSRYHWYAVISKFMYFTTRPTIFLAGWHGFEFKKFLKITTYATVIWATIIMIIGYGFGQAINGIGFKKVTHRIELFAVAVFVGIFILEWLIKKLIMKRIVKRVGPTTPIGK